MARLEHRLRLVEIQLNRQQKNAVSEPKFVSLLDLPKEIVIGAFEVLKAATGGYQYMLQLDKTESANSNEYICLNQLTPREFYNLMVTHGITS
jgi:hypothetical protein